MQVNISDQDAVRLDPNRTLGVEALTFEGVEVEKFKGGIHSFATFGNLQVLYFRDYNRWFLSVNNWKYAIMDQLPIMRADMEPLSYILNLEDGFYMLRFTVLPTLEALQNFETILSLNSLFSYEEEGLLPRQRGTSPEAKPLFSFGKGTIASEIYKTNPIPADAHCYRSDKFRKRDTIKREVLKAADKVSNTLIKKPENNINVSQVRTYDELVATAIEFAPAHYLKRKEIEENIVLYSKIMQFLTDGTPQTGLKPFSQRAREIAFANIVYIKNQLAPLKPIVKEQIDLVKSGLPIGRNQENELGSYPAEQNPGLMEKMKSKIPFLNKESEAGAIQHTSCTHEKHAKPTVAEKIKDKVSDVIAEYREERRHEITPPYVGTSYAGTSYVAMPEQPTFGEKIKGTFNNLIHHTPNTELAEGSHPTLGEKIKGAISNITHRNTASENIEDQAHPSLVDKIKTTIHDVTHRHSTTSTEGDIYTQDLQSNSAHPTLLERIKEKLPGHHNAENFTTEAHPTLKERILETKDKIVGTINEKLHRREGGLETGDHEKLTDKIKDTAEELVYRNERKTLESEPEITELVTSNTFTDVRRDTALDSGPRFSNTVNSISLDPAYESMTHYQA